LTRKQAEAQLRRLMQEIRSAPPGERLTPYMAAKAAEGLQTKTISNHLNFVHGLFAFAVKRGWASNP
jgi:hypothetical protein